MKILRFALLVLSLILAANFLRAFDDAPCAFNLREVKNKWRETRLQFAGKDLHLPYYTSSPWGENEDYFIFFSLCKDGASLCAYSLKDGKVAREIPLKSQRFRRFDSALLLPRSNSVLIPYGNSLYEVSLSSGKERLVFKSPFEACSLGCSHVSSDGKFVVIGEYVRNSKTKQVESTNMLILQSSDFKLLKRVEFKDFLANHFQFMSDSDYVLYAHEGSTKITFDRINRVNWKTGAKENLHGHFCDEGGNLLECIGHEMQYNNGVVAVRYPVSKLRGALVAMDCNGENYRIVDFDDYWHCSTNADGSVIAADTMWWGKSKRKTKNRMDIIRVDLNKATKEILKTINSSIDIHKQHPHPILNKSGAKVLFVENSDNSDNSSITLFELVN